MSRVIGKRKRARKACIPCHQRKRKCDAHYPCSMCVAYEYNCRYDDDGNTGAAGVARNSPRPVRRVGFDGAGVLATIADTTSPSLTNHADVAGMNIERERLLRDPTAASASIFDENKFRYAGSSAAMAFPHVLSVALGSEGAPKMHSFAYNFGNRPDEASNTHRSLSELISETDLAHYSGIYFSVMGSVGDLIDPRIYAQRCRDCYRGIGSATVAFGAVAAGIAALGSFLSANRYSRESDLTQYAKAILDDPASMHMLDIDHIVAWGMRVFYLRATSRPNNAWIASCTTMHLCEAVGLHEEENIKKIASVSGAAALGHDVDRLRRIFWISWAGHTLLSYEYDRSCVHFRNVTCQAIMPISGSVADQFVQIIQIIPAPNSPFRLECQPSTAREELFERLKSLDRLQFLDPFLMVTKADLAFCFYRRIYQLKMGISDEIVQLLVRIGTAAVEAAEQLARQGRLFWNVIGSVFHFACVLLAIDIPSASAHIPTVLKGLESLVNAADTRMTREALSMAHHLLSLSLAKKRRELAQLEPIEARSQVSHAQPEPETAIAMPDFGLSVDWDQFLLEPYVSMFSQHVQLM